MKSSTHRLAGRVVWALGRASQESQRLIRERVAAAGLRTQHYHVLASLADDGEAAQAQLADRIGLDRSDLVTILDELADRGYLARRTDPADRRRNIVAITPAGTGYLTDLDELILAAETELLAPLTATERQTLLRLLKQLVPDD